MSPNSTALDVFLEVLEISSPLAALDWLVGWLVGFYGIPPFLGYLTPNPFLCK